MGSKLGCSQKPAKQLDVAVLAHTIHTTGHTAYVIGSVKELRFYPLSLKVKCEYKMHTSILATSYKYGF